MFVKFIRMEYMLGSGLFLITDICLVDDSVKFILLLFGRAAMYRLFC